MPNYDAIRLFHRVEATYSDSETHRRLEEVRYPTYPNDPRCKALARDQLFIAAHDCLP